MKQWFHLEHHDFFLETIPDAFKDLNIPLAIPNYSPIPELPATTIKLKKHLETVRPDIILTTGWTHFQRERYLEIVRNYCRDHRAFHVFWSFEDPNHTDIWGKYMAEMAAPDFIFTHAIGFENVYKTLGIPSAYLPFAIKPTLHCSQTPIPEFQSDIALVGSFNPLSINSVPLRMESLKILLEPLIKEGYDIAIWGNGWKEHRHKLPFDLPEKYIKEPVDYQYVPKIYNSAKIILGIQNEPILLTRRTFECMGSGGLLLTIDTPAVRNHFIRDRHVAISSNRTETLQQVNRLLHNPGLRKHIATSGQKEVHANHTYTARIKKMMDTIQPYVEAKKENQTIFALPQQVRKEVRPKYDVTASNRVETELKEEYLTITRETSNHNEETQVYIQFKLDSEAFFEVTAATLKLFMGMPSIGNPVLNCYAVESSWSIQHLIDRKYPSISKEPIGSITIDKPFDTNYPWKYNWYSLDLTSLVQQWISGKKSNHGICLTLAPQKRGSVYFISTRWRKSQYIGTYGYYIRLHPRLEIEYQKKVDKKITSPWIFFTS